VTSPACNFSVARTSEATVSWRSTSDVCQRMSGTKRGTKLSETHRTENTEEPHYQGLSSYGTALGAAPNPKSRVGIPPPLLKK
jgi:hypothetical protein